MKYTNNHNLPDSIVRAIVEDPYDYPKDSHTIPASVLISPIKKAVLSNRHDEDIMEDVSDNIWRLFGQSIHYIIGKQSDDNCLSETRLFNKVGQYTVTGKPDYFLPNTGQLIDFKVTSVWTYIFSLREGKKEWENQLNVYAWLLRKNGYNVSKLTITAILRDWAFRESNKSEDYPLIAIQDVDIPLWDEERQQEFISTRLDMLASESSKEDNDITVCLPEERWATKTTWAVMKEGRSRAVRVLESEQEAADYIGDTKNLFIVKRPGEDRRCTGYCSVKQWCNYYKERYENEANINSV